MNTNGNELTGRAQAVCDCANMMPPEYGSRPYSRAQRVKFARIHVLIYLCFSSGSRSPGSVAWHLAA